MPVNDLWDLIRNVAEVIGMVAIPIFSWVVWTLIQQGKQIIVLEQKVNDSLNQRLIRVEHRVASVEEKIDDIAENVVECRLIANDTQNMHKHISSQFDVLISKVDNLDKKK